MSETTVSAMTLNPRQQAFVERFVAYHGNATRAAREAGYSAVTASQTGYRLLATPHITEAIRLRTLAMAGGKLEMAMANLARSVTDAEVEPRTRVHAANVIVEYGSPPQRLGVSVEVRQAA